jgi:hypothetical protein
MACWPLVLVAWLPSFFRLARGSPIEIVLRQTAD